MSDSAMDNENFLCPKTGERIFCMICHEQYTTEPAHLPKLLSCFHTFCLSCLEKETKNGSIDCPCCFQTTVLPVSAVHGLANNFVLTQLLIDTFASKTDAVQVKNCQMCDDPHPALFFCNECNNHMCTEANALHSRFALTKTHKVTQTVIGKVASNKLGANFLCATHNQEPRYVCVQDQKLLCVECFSLEYHGKKCISVDEAFNSEQGDLKELMDLTQGKLSMYGDSIGNVERVLQGVQKQSSKVKDQIEDYFAELHNLLDARKQQLLNQVTGLVDNKSNILHNQLETLTACALGISSGHGQMEYVIEKEGPSRVLSMKRMLSNAVQNVMLKNIPTEPLTQCDFAFLTSAEAAEALNIAGDIETSSTSTVHTVVEGQGVVCCVPKVPAYFTIKANCAKGQQRKTGGDQWTIFLSIPGSKVDIVDNTNGTYDVTYVLGDMPENATGAEQKDATLSVMLGSKHIVGSPFALKHEVLLTWNATKLGQHPAGRDGTAFSGNGFSRDPAVIANAWAKVMGYSKAVGFEIKAGGNLVAVYHFEKATPLERLKALDFEKARYSSAYKLSDPVIYNIQCV